MTKEEIKQKLNSNSTKAKSLMDENAQLEAMLKDMDREEADEILQSIKGKICKLSELGFVLAYDSSHLGKGVYSLNDVSRLRAIFSKDFYKDDFYGDEVYI